MGLMSPLAGMVLLASVDLLICRPMDLSRCTLVGIPLLDPTCMTLLGMRLLVVTRRYLLLCPIRVPSDSTPPTFLSVLLV